MTPLSLEEFSLAGFFYMEANKGEKERYACVKMLIEANKTREFCKSQPMSKRKDGAESAE